MNEIFKFNSVKVAVFVTILYSLTQVIAMKSFTLLKVNDKGDRVLYDVVNLSHYGGW